MPSIFNYCPKCWVYLQQRKLNIPDATELQFNYKGRSKSFKQSWVFVSHQGNMPTRADKQSLTWRFPVPGEGHSGATSGCPLCCLMQLSKHQEPSSNPRSLVSRKDLDGVSNTFREWSQAPRGEKIAVLHIWPGIALGGDCVSQNWESCLWAHRAGVHQVGTGNRKSLWGRCSAEVEEASYMKEAKTEDRAARHQTSGGIIKRLGRPCIPLTENQRS